MHRSMMCLAISLCILTAASARAAVIYSSMNDGSNGTYAVENINDNNVTWASEFLTPPGTTLTLTATSAMLEQGLGSGSVTAYLYNNTATGNAPNANLDTIATVAHSSIPTSPGQVDFTAPTGPGAIVLQPNTEYWVVMSGSDNSVVDGRWQYGTGDTGPGVTGVAGQNYAEFDGVAWVGLSNDQNTNGIPEMEVDATSAPEPNAFAVFGVGLLGVAVARRRYA